MEDLPSSNSPKKSLNKKFQNLFNSFSSKNPYSSKELFTLDYKPKRRATFHKKSKNNLFLVDKNTIPANLKESLIKPLNFQCNTKLDELLKYEEILLDYNIIDFTCK